MQGNKNIEAEFLELIQKHQGILHKISYAYANKGFTKDDLNQEMILQLWRSFEGFKEQAKFSTWMYRVALNTAISLTRKTNLFVETSITHSPTYEIESSYEFSEEVKVLYKAIAQLDKLEKAIVLLWLEEQSYQEIADTVGLSVNNVSVKLVRIKKKLADIMKRFQ